MSYSVSKSRQGRKNLYRFKSAKIVKKRLPLVKGLIKDKTVLDIGSVQHISSFESDTNFLFKFLLKYAKSVVGIDKEEAEVDLLKKKGYNIIAGDAESIKLNTKFDVIMAGNVLEHLSNPGLFLNNMKAHLKNDGKIIITTDNEGGFISFFHTLCLGYIPENSDHTMIFNYSHLRELVNREGLKINKYYFYTQKDMPRHSSSSIISNVYSGVKHLLLSFFLLLRKNFSPGCILILTKE